MDVNYKSIISAISLFFALATSISAAPGDLDPTFGSGGIVITRDGPGYGFDYALGMAIQADGKIVVVGEGATSNTWDFAVVRYNTDGSLDSSFGGTGIVITPVGNSHDTARSVVIQADGKIVVAGSIYNSVGTGSSLAVVRYNPNGSLDTSFNGTGKVITSESSGAVSVAIQADGKIIVSGGNVLIRYNTNGSLDTSFNGTGIVIIQGGGAVSVAIQSDGKIVAAGGSQNSFAVVRYNTDGSLDTSFNGTGMIITPVGNSSSAIDLAIQTDGKIVVVGSSEGVPGDFRTADFAVVRYNPNGSLDATFNGTGEVIISVGNSYEFVSSVAIQTDGKIVVAGTIRNNNGLGSNFAVVRLNPNGALDTTFNGTGKVTTAFCCQEFTSAVAIQTDGKIVVAGATDDQLYDFYDFVVVRYQGDDATPTPTCPNPIDCADFFVRQQYLDFLNREPDPVGFQGWLAKLNQCPESELGNRFYAQDCTRIDVSASFFRSREFSFKGYYVYRFYQVSYGRRPLYAEFLPDTRSVTGATDEEFEQRRAAFPGEWVTRQAFKEKYDALSNSDYVNMLLQTTGVTLAGSNALVDDLNSGQKNRAQVLREIVESTEVEQKFYDEAFVAMQYFGYLRRDPDADGYNGWLNHLNRTGNYREMVWGFLYSPEYKLRFGPVPGF